MNASVPAGTFINEHDALSFMRECDALMRPRDNVCEDKRWGTRTPGP